MTTWLLSQKHPLVEESARALAHSGYRSSGQKLLAGAQWRPWLSLSVVQNARWWDHLWLWWSIDSIGPWPGLSPIPHSSTSRRLNVPLFRWGSCFPVSAWAHEAKWAKQNRRASLLPALTPLTPNPRKLWLLRIIDTWYHCKLLALKQYWY